MGSHPDKTEGSLKEAAGVLTDNDSLMSKGLWDQVAREVAVGEPLFRSIRRGDSLCADGRPKESRKIGRPQGGRTA